MREMDTQKLTRAGVIAALYAAITLVFAPISFGPVQLRVSEALTLLPILWPEAVPGLFIGCFVSNLIGGYGIIDAVVGGLATLVAALMTYRLRGNRYLAALPPVIINALAIGLLLHVVDKAPLLLTMLYVGAGQAVSCYALGVPLLSVLSRTGLAHQR